MKQILEKIEIGPASWKSLFCITFLSAYLYVFLEWLFIITKPSFLSTAAFLKKVEIFFFSASLLAVGCSLGVMILFIGSRALPKNIRFQRTLLALAAFIPAAVMASLALLLVDNFTYTVFYFGIATSTGIFRGLYGLGFLIALGWFYVRILKAIPGANEFLANRRSPKLLVPAAIVFLVATLVLTYHQNDAGGLFTGKVGSSAGTKLPNIILITADGLNASHTSLYGYERDTTPRLRELAKTSLLAENVFSNAGSTAGSLISIYTGKYPVETGVLYPPNILKGQDSYQHLPGILRSNGYYTVQYTTDHYADANDLNLLSGFDMANGQAVLEGGALYRLRSYLQTDHAYFIYEIANRIFDRLRHIFFLKAMTNNQALVQAKTQKFDDTGKIKKIMDVLQTSNQPVFAHLHWMGTHGPIFNPENQIFSLGQTNDLKKPWLTDFYDDSILDFDTAVGRLIDELVRKGFSDNTTLIIGSDHGQKFVTNVRLPLLIHFPGGQHAGTIKDNVQNLDISPTILEFLGIKKPSWMEGRSLLQGEPGNRPIISVGIYGAKIENRDLVVEKLEPPFYQFGFIQVIDCNTVFLLNLRKMEWSQKKVEGYSGSCDQGQVPGDETVLGWMSANLKAGGFDTSTLKDFSTITKK